MVVSLPEFEKWLGVQELFSPGAAGGLTRVWAPRKGLFALSFDPAKRADGLKLCEEREGGKLVMVRLSLAR